MKKTSILNLSMGIILIFISSCGTIIHGTKQTIGISSNPSRATVTINGQNFGETPINTELSRKYNYIVKIDLEGYWQFEATLSRKVSGWFVGNLFLGPPVSFAVDIISGAMFKLSPDQIQAKLRKETAQLIRNDNIYFFVTLEPDPEWEKIGNLEIQK